MPVTTVTVQQECAAWPGAENGQTSYFPPHVWSMSVTRPTVVFGEYAHWVLKACYACLELAASSGLRVVGY